MKVLWILPVAGVLTFSQAHAVVRYVNSTGSCAGGAPCFSTVQAAVNASTAAGDVIEIEGNTRYIENVVVATKTNLTIRARAGDSPTIVSTNATPLTVQNSPTFTLSGVNLDASVPGRTAFVVAGTANRSDGLIVKNCVIRGGNGDGVNLSVSMSNSLFENVEFLNAGNTTGYRASASTAKFVNNIVRNCRFTSNRRHMVLANQHNFLLENCVFHRATDTALDPALRPAIEISGSAFTDAVPPGITIRRNLFFAYHGACIRVGVATPAAQNVVIEHNTIVSNNEPDGREGILFRGGSTGVVRNNVIVSAGRWAALATDAVTPGLTQDHNLIVNSGSLTSVSGTFPITTTSTPALGPGSIVADSAGFVDEFAEDFRLSCASPGRGAASTGINLGYTNALSAADCADCASRDSDGDGVNDCVDLCPLTPSCADVNSVGCPATTNLFSFGSVWQYDDRGLDLDDPVNGNTTWRSSGLTTPTFGPGQLGFGELDQATVIARNAANRTYYFSKVVSIPDPAAFGELRLELLRDDGFVAYVNGVEVGRSENMPSGPISFSTLAIYDAENAMERGIFIPIELLVAGDNIFVVEMHQETVGSSDLSFDAQLVAVPCRVNRPPVARCRDVTVNADHACRAAASVDDGSFDPDGDPISLNQVPPGPYPLGTNSVTLFVTDVHGAFSQCSATVIVRDVTAPTISCPPDMTVNTDPGQCFATGVALGQPIVGDNCGVASVTNDAPAQFPKGDTLVQWTVTDTSGNAAVCTQKVTVRDVEPPVIVCAAELSVQCASQVPAPDISAVSAQDNCDVPTVAFVGDLISDQTCANRFTITRSYRATDSSGNSAACAQTIRVNDTTAPGITCPADVTVESEANVPAPNFAGGSASDNCGSVTVTHIGDSSVTNACGKVITRTYKATDDCGNTTTCTQTITVAKFFATDGIIWLAPIARSPANADTNPSLYTQNGAGTNAAPGGILVARTFKAGSTLPIKIDAIGCVGNASVVNDSTVSATVELWGDTNADGVEDTLVPSIDFNGVGALGGVMDKINGHFQFNLNTKSLPAGGTNRFILKVTIKRTTLLGTVSYTERVLLLRK